MLTAVFVLSAILFTVAFFTYGRFLERRFEIDNRRATPSHTDYDGVDRVPAHPAVLFGHHFSSIAGAGPIVGPIIAAVAFGWAVPLVWVLTGAIFIGGVHDFSALVASVRNRGRSIADIARESMSPLAYRLLVIFMWLALSTFILTTLDTATRLGRYIFEEFFQLHAGPTRYAATLATLAMPTVFALITLHDVQGQPIPAWKAIWPVFGATNQLLAGLTLLVLAVWLRRSGPKTGFIWLPLVFMTVATLYALVLLIRQYGSSLIGVIGMVLMALAILLIVEFVRTMYWRKAGLESSREFT